jgi:hypothetical protein
MTKSCGGVEENEQRQGQGQQQTLRDDKPKEQATAKANMGVLRCAQNDELYFCSLHVLQFRADSLD